MTISFGIKFNTKLYSKIGDASTFILACVFSQGRAVVDILEWALESEGSGFASPLHHWLAGDLVQDPSWPPQTPLSHLYNGGSTSSHLSGMVVWALIEAVQPLAQCLAYAKVWLSSYCRSCACRCGDSILHSASRDDVSILSSQPEASLQSWLSCSLSLATDTMRTPSRQSGIGSHILSPR